MKLFPAILSGALACTFVSCQQSPPPPKNNGAPAALDDLLGAPQGVAAQAEVVTLPPTPEPTKRITRNPNTYPLAVPTPEAGIVLSPYKPYNKVRVSKLKSGDLAEDPDNRGMIFRVP
ncbi:MAG: hypothetical protein CBC46_01405 [Verrucomicrobiaceae bacterium TMED86]|nr:MAG: hypothetical protein CBC46_01405 [Verrucomicrobiaceae bacterium TMED86]